MPGSVKTWVTLALNEEQVVQALVLGQSLRKVQTRWNIIILTNGLLSHRSSRVLTAVFDYVVPVETGHLGKDQKNGISEELYCKLSCWNLPFAKRCIFTQPDTIIMRNCDDLMDSTGFLVAVDRSSRVDSSVFVYDPSWQTFNDLLKLAQTHKDLSKVLDVYWGKRVTPLAGSYFITIDPTEPLPIIGIAECAMMKIRGIDLIKESKGHNQKQKGTIVQKIIHQWEETFHKEVEHLLQENLEAPLERKEVPQEPIAIVGMGCRLPEANNLQEFWKLMIEGGDAIRPLPLDRLPAGTAVDAAKGMKAGYLKCPIDEFDRKFFGISPLELSFLDPQTRILLEVLWEALEDAAIDPQSIKGTDAGLFCGTWTQDYKERINSRGAQPTEDFFRKYMGSSFGASAGRLSFILGVTGPNIATESGCSSSMVALDIACKRLRLGETRLAMACGVNLVLHIFSGNDMDSICAPDGHCKTFDASADGFGRAEGCGVLVLKKYSDAIHDGDRIHALIRGMGAAQEGISRSLGTPTVECESGAMKMALKSAGVEPWEVSYVESHGTGTPVGDPMEMASIAAAYHSERRTENLIVGSVKTNIGHTESCSGITGIIKTVLSLQKEIIPPHRNFQTLNPNVNLEAVPATIPLTQIPWPRKEGKVRYAGVSSFGITGTDAHAIIEEAPAKQPQNALDFGMTRPQHILTVSAKSEPALEALLLKYKEHLETEMTSAANATFTANTGRSHFPHRAAVLGKTREEIANNIGKRGFLKGKVGEEQEKICFLFTGQGSQYKGMGKSLYETSPEFKFHFDACEVILRKTFGVSILPVLWGDKKEETDQISRTIYSQTSIFCIEYCLLKLWESWGVKPDCVLGHSLGEFAAATAAGILSLEDALTLVAERSRLIDNLPRGQMIVLRSGKSTVDQVLKEFQGNDKKLWLDMAAVNSDEQTVLAGDTSTVQRFAEFCNNNKIKSIILESTHAFHSRHMDPMLQEYSQVASKIQFNPSTCKFISGMDGKVVDSDQMNSNYWVRHTRESVKFIEASKLAYAEGCRLFLEVGPQPVLSALTMNNQPCFESQDVISCLPSLRKNTDEWNSMLTTLSKLYIAGVQINWKNFDKFYQRQKVTLPTYPFQRKKHWFDENVHSGPIQLCGTEIHTLLGCLVPNASKTSIYQGILDLKKTPYVKDHVVGTSIIQPGASFLEMSLVAGFATTQGFTSKFDFPSNPISFENLVIEAPLELTESQGSSVQVIVVPNESSGSVISVFSEVRKEEGSQKQWIRHTSGKFSPYSVDHEKEAKHFVTDLSTLQSRINEERNGDKFYANVNEMGLKFGANYKSIKRYWKNTELGEVLCMLETPSDSEDYLCHPILTDAMIQTFICTKFDLMPQLLIPVHVAKFIWFCKVETPIVYTHSFAVQGGIDSNNIVLYDANGKVIALMAGIIVVETNVSAVMSTLSQQKLSCPPMYEDKWKCLPGPLYNRPNLLVTFQNGCLPENNQSLSHFNKLQEIDIKFLPVLDELCFLYVQRAFYDLGWKPAVGEVVTAQQFCEHFSISNKFERFVNRLLMILSEEGLLTGVKDSVGQFTEWKVKQLPTNYETVIKTIKEHQVTLGVQTPKAYGCINLTAICANQLVNVLQGKASPVEIMFTTKDDGEDNLAEQCYRIMKAAKYLVELEKVALKMIIEKHMEGSESSRGVLQILEVGAGTGSLTQLILPILEELKAPYQYTYTDISSAFFPKAEKMFEPYAKKMSYKVLDLEKDPLDQGFYPQQFDMILSVNVLHICKYMSECVRNLRRLTSPHGVLFVSETIAPDREVDLTFGLFEGYWQYKDLELRPNHCSMDLRKWERVFTENGYDQVSTNPFMAGKGGTIVGRASKALSAAALSAQLQSQHKPWIIFSQGKKSSEIFARQLNNVDRQAFVITKSSQFKKLGDFQYQICPHAKSDMTTALTAIKEDCGTSVEGIIYLWGEDGAEVDQKMILEPFLYLTQLVTEGILGKMPKLFVVTSGACNAGEHVLSNPSGATLWGFARSLRLEAGNLRCRNIDMDSNELSEKKVEEAFMEMWKKDGECQLAFRERSIYVPRMTAKKFQMLPLTLPNSDRFKIQLPASKAISDLRFVPNPKSRDLGDHEVEIQIQAYALNFKDVFAVIKPSEKFKTFNSVGDDLAGIVSAVGCNVRDKKVGDSVFGCTFGGEAMPNYVTVSSDSVVPIPNHWTFDEAVTLPVVFATAYYCIVPVADMKANETILIHAASGGVGLCAIQLAKHLGLKIIATAGSHRKRAYLKNLGIDHIFNSRTLDYEAQIKEVTKGKGVDMVLNCLTGPGFKEASLNSCAKGARFVEMSKLDTWEPEEVAARRSDVRYDIVDLTTVSKSVWTLLLSKMSEFMKSNIIRPIPYTPFDCIYLREALNHLQKAKHIGKVIVRMPKRTKNTVGEVETKFDMFNDSSTYLITGGLGGIGLEVAKWMAKSGAKYIVLVGRNGPNPKAVKTMEALKKEGKHVISIKTDVGQLDQCQNLLETLKDPSLALPTLRGIMHAAGSLSDALLENQSWSKFESTIYSKVKGGWNLHNLTKSYPLEHFVMYSSIVGTMGNPGQTNHASGNAFLDALAFHRNSTGLPALTINWGQWSEVGVAADIKATWMRPFNPSEGILALERIMKSNQIQGSVCEIDFGVHKKLSASVSHYFEDIKLNTNSGPVAQAGGDIIDEKKFKEELEKADEGSKPEVVEKYVELIVRQVLKVDSSETVDRDENIYEMGIDSLMMVEVKNSLQNLAGNEVVINPRDLMPFQTIKGLGQFIFSLLVDKPSEV